MALLHWDSFDHYNTSKLLYKWTSWYVTSVLSSVTIGAVGRNSTDGLGLSYNTGHTVYARRALPSTPDVVILGVAVYPTSMPPAYAPILALLDNTTYQILVRLLNDGTVQVWRGNATALLASSVPGTLDPTVYHYFEIKATIDNAAGAVEVHVDDSQVISVSGVDTQESGTAQVTQIQLGGTIPASGGWGVYYDDLYVCDDSGGYCNDFLGDTRVCALLPQADATHTDWTPSAGVDHYAMVDEASPDDDTTYNSSATATDRDTFDMDTLPVGVAGTVHAVCAVICSRKDDAGTRTLEPSVRVGGSDYDGTPVNIPSNYAYHNMYAWETNPDTAAVWLVAEVNNPLESGYELAA